MDSSASSECVVTISSKRRRSNVANEMMQATEKLMEQQRANYERQCVELRNELADWQERAEAAEGERDTEALRAGNVEQELAKRKAQLREATSRIVQLEETAAANRASGKEAAAERDRLQKHLYEQRMAAEGTVMSLETKLAKERAVSSQLEEQCRVEAERHAAAVGTLRRELDELSRRADAALGEKRVVEERLSVREAQVEELRTPQRLQRTESMEDRLVSQVRRLAEQMSAVKDTQDAGLRIEDAREQLASLKTANEFLKQRIEENSAAESALTGRISQLEIENEKLADQLKELQTVFDDKENDAASNEKRLLAENSKIKQQKADMRVKFMDLERESNRIKMEMSKENRDIESNKAEVELLQTRLSEVNKARLIQSEEMDALVKRLDAAETESTECRHRADYLQKRLSEADELSAVSSSAADSRFTQMEARVSQLTDEKRTLQGLCSEMDEQCCQLQSLRERDATELAVLRGAEADAARCARVLVELEQTKQRAERLERDKQRHEKKAAHLQEELVATHTDYKAELARLAGQLHDERRRGASDGEKRHIDQAHVETQKRQLESEMRSLERRLDESAAERSQADQQLSQLNDELERLRGSAAQMASGLKSAIEKAESYKRDAAVLRDERAKLVAAVESLKSDRSSLTAEAAVLQEKATTAQEEMRMAEYKYETQIQQQSKLIDYLQGQVGQSSKKKGFGGILRPVSPGGKTAMAKSAVSIPDMFHNKQSSSKLETKLYTLRKEHIAEREARAAGAGEVSSDVALTPSRTVAQVTLSLPADRRTRGRGDSESASSEAASSASSSTTAAAAAATAAVDAPGTMVHNIPHRWVKFFVIYHASKCATCLDGLPFARPAYRCTECGTVVHRRCARGLLNTCGLPVIYTEYFLGQQKRMSQRGAASAAAVDAGQSLRDTPSARGRMTGWVKLRRSDRPDAGWVDAWGTMDEGELNFFDDDEAATSRARPIESIDLSAQSWRIHFQDRVDDEHAVASNDMPFVVEIKIDPPNPNARPYRLYLIAPTLPAKQRWVNALQVATTRQQFKQRSLSLSLHENCLLRLEAPHNLNVHSVATIRNKYLLMGCEEGLFFTRLQKPDIPRRIAGVDAVVQLQPLPDVDMLIAIVGINERQLGCIQLEELCLALSSGHPGVKVTVIPDVQLCHMFATVEAAGERYLCVAEPERVLVMTLSAKLHIVKHFREVPTEEPATCLAQFGRGLLIGADRFLLVDFASGLVADFLDPTDASLEYAVRAAPKRADYPVGAVVLSPGADNSEVLLAYQNFAIFVSAAGRRTRRGDVDWVRCPQQFAYMAPYLYVMNVGSVEVFQVPPYVGEDSKLLERRTLLEVAQPHVVGKLDGALLVSSCQPDATDLLCFSAADASELKSSRSLLKRRPQTSQRTTDEEKRPKAV